MFGIGFWELILIFVIALIVFGPEKLPKIATSLGRAYYEFRKTFEEVKFDIETEVRDLDREIEKAEESEENIEELSLPSGEEGESAESDGGKEKETAR